MYACDGLLLPEFCTQQTRIIKSYKDPFLLLGSYGFSGVVDYSSGMFYLFRTAVLKETRLQKIPLMNDKLNKS